MSGGMETELKLKMLQAAGCEDGWLAFRDLDTIRNLAAEWVTTDMEAWYYDTGEQDLQQAGIAYRVRREGDRWIATVKTNGSSNGGLHQRQEYNADSPGKEPGPDLFSELPIGPALLQAINDKPLQPLFATVFERSSAQVCYENTCIELAFDNGKIIAGDRSEPICEIELELKAGDSATLLRLGAALARELPLVPEHKSKFYRALLLAGLDEAQPKPVVAIQEQMLVAESLTVLLAAAIGKVFAAYQDFVDNPHEQRAAHQLRVKLRRLRSLFQFAKPCLAEAEFLLWKERLAQLSGVLAPLRDLDAMDEEWRQLCNSPYIAFDSRPWLGENINKRRTILLEQAGQQLSQINLSASLLELWAWLDSQPWQQGDYPSAMGSYARWRIGGWLAALLDAGKAADWQNDQELHDIRLRLKRVRYSLAAMPLRSGRAEKLLLQAKELQSLLGAINDSQASVKTLALLSRGATRAIYRDIGMLSGWQAKAQETIRGKLRPQWKEFRQAARRWLEA